MPALIFGLIVFYRPFWGLMDDAVNISTVRKMKELGFWAIWQQETASDLFGSGRMRGLYQGMVWAIYGPGGENSLVAFLLNAALVCGVFFVLSLAFSRSASMIFKLRGRFDFAVIFFLFCFAYPWSRYFFLAPSLQEKLVLLFSGILLLALYAARNVKSDLWWSIGILLPLLFALNSKEQIALFFPLLLAFQLHLGAPEKKWRRIIVLLFFLVASAILIKWAGSHGDYKDRYGLEAAVINLKKSKTVWLFLTLGFLGIFVSVMRWWKERDLLLFLHRMAYPAGLILNVMIMLPWGLGHYLNTVSLVFFFFCLFLLWDWIAKDYAAGKLTTIFSATTAVAVTFLLTGPTISAYGDLGKIISSAPFREIAQQNRIFHIPCQEGAERIEQYADWFQGLDIAVLVDQEVAPDSNPDVSGIWMFSPSRCTNGFDFGRVGEAGRLEYLFRGRYPSGFHLVRIESSANSLR